MNGRLKLFMLFLMMILTMLLTVYITYAWFNVTKESKPIIITTGSVKQNSHYYVGVDSNYDGTLDKDENDQDIYQEVFQGGFTMQSAIPGQIFTFKLIIINDGTVDGNLSITMNDITVLGEAEGGVSLLQYFEVSYTNPTTSLPIDITLDNRVNNDILLFSGLTLLTNTGYFEFDFTIKALETIPTNLGGVQLKISNYIISLVQTDMV